MMRKLRSISRLGAIFLIVVCVPALGGTASKPGKQHGTDDGPVARLADAPQSAHQLRNPYVGDPKALAAGQKLFRRHCESCHGTEGYGEGHAADLHAEEIKDAPAGVLFWAISNGRLRRGMPSWTGLPEAQRWQLVTYLKSLK